MICFRLLILGLVTMVMLQVIMILRYEVSWDEFLNLSMLYDHRRGDLSELLQTGFIHLIAWVPVTTDNEVGQVIAARAMVAVFAFSTSWSIYAISCALASSKASFFAVLAYWSFSFVFVHGVELRTDAMAIGLIMPALWLAITQAERKVPMLVAGALIGLAGVLTVKSIFFVPMLIVVALIRGSSKQGMERAIGAIICAGAVALVAFLGVVGLHSLTFDEYASPFAFLNRTITATFGMQAHSLFLYYAIRALLNNALQCFMALVGLCLAVFFSIRGPRLVGLYGLTLASPLLVPFVYRDVYPYFYVMLLAPVAPLWALAFEAWSKRSQGVGTLLVVGVLALITVNMFRKWDQTNAEQRLVLKVVHELFDAETPYIDGRSMVASSPKVGIFMSTWGMSDYRRAAEPVMAGLLSQAHPEFLLRTNWQLDLEGTTPEVQEAHPYGLLAEDVRMLQSTFVPFWGPIHLPGARFEAGVGTVYLHLDGLYKNMTNRVVFIENQTVLSGQSVFLKAGTHEILAELPGQLRQDLPMPTVSAPEGPLFKGF